jgi:hypothetical protein
MSTAQARKITRVTALSGHASKVAGGGWLAERRGRDRDAELRELPTFVHALGLAQVTISISLGRQDPSRLSCQLLSIQRLWKNRSVGL